MNSDAKYIDWDSPDCYDGGGYDFDCLLYGGRIRRVAYDSSGKSTLTKAIGIIMPLSSGALKSAKVNNIYDMAGNYSELTMERYSDEEVVVRGAGYSHVAAGVYSFANDSKESGTKRLRVALYIK